MNPFTHEDDRVIEPTPARRQRALDRGDGPRAPWLAAALSGLLALGLLSVAAGPVAIETKAWIRQSLQVHDAPAMTGSALLLPAVSCAAVVLVAAMVGQVVARGGWIRVRAWRRGRRAAWSETVASSIGGWVLGVAALLGGVLGAAPWLGSLGQISQRPLQEGLWALGAFVAAAALSALLATLVMGLVQLRLAGLAFDRTLRMTRGEAREAAKDDSPRRRMQRARWRLA